MDEKERSPQYYIDIVAAMAERTIFRLWIVVILLSVLLVGSWIGFFVYESQFETITTTTQEVTQEAENGSNQFVGGDYYGSANNQDDNH